MTGPDVPVYDCAGLRLRSPIPLSSRLAPPGSEADVEVVVGAPRFGMMVRPSEDVVAESIVDGTPMFTYARTGEGIVGRFFEIGDFVISDGLDRVTCHARIGGSTSLVPLLLAGSVTAFILAMRGECVLHASAVDIGGRAVAFVGPSGRGKTTLATVFCAAGASLVTDDVLPLGFTAAPGGGEGVTCRPSAHELRIRPKSSGLLDLFADDVEHRITVDDRHALAPATAGEPLPLAAVLLPRPDPSLHAVQAARLDPGEAGMSLADNQRTTGWREPARLRRCFHDISRVAAAVPVLTVAVPWGPPFSPTLAAEVLAACDLPGLGVARPAARAVGD